jgi:hypothetical protein
MGYYNFARNGYTVLNAQQPGECWDLGAARVVFKVGDPAGDRCTMSFSRPVTDADRARRAAGISLDGPDEGQQLSRGGGLVVALLNLFNVVRTVTDSQPVEQSVNAFGLGFDDGHVGSRERHHETYEQAVRDAGREGLARYRDKLAQGGFFTGAPDWHTRGALASESDVMILRIDETFTHLEIVGFVDDRRAGVCRVTTGYAVRRGVEVRPPR